MVRLFLIVLAVIAVSFSGCGRDGESTSTQTEVVIRMGDSAPSLAGLLSALDPSGPFFAYNGGAILFAQSTDSGDAVFKGGRKYIPAAGSVTWSIPNGTYRFWVIGYPSASMGSTPACAQVAAGNAITLSGGTQELGALTLGSCASSPFGNGTAVASAVNMSICTNAVGGANSTIGTCSSLSFGAPGVSYYLRLSIDESSEFDATTLKPFTGFSTDGVRSTCVVAITGEASSVAIPVPGDSSDLERRIIYDLAVYSASNQTECNAGSVTGWLGSYRFPRGLGYVDGSSGYNTYKVNAIGSTPSDVPTYARWVRSGSTAKLFIKVP